jgi:shikimate kinase
MKKNIFIVGFMGTGKSTIGRELARLLGRQFLDMDVMVEKRFGMSVNQIFSEKGEEFFRQEEKKLAFELSLTNNKVIATGGGTIMDEDVRATFAQKGILICLFTDKHHLITRLTRTDKRPLLKGDVENKVDRLLEERREIYDSIPLKVNTTNLSPKEAARKIVDLFHARQKVLDQLRDQYITIGDIGSSEERRGDEEEARREEKQ